MPTQWSAADIPDQRERLAVVTGANSGIGLAATAGLAQAGADVILACRSRARAEAAIAELGAAGVATARLEFRPCDLSDLASVRAFAADLRRERGPIDLLINNAGVMALPYRRTADGFEMQLGTNHLGHFALTGLVLDHLRGPGSRIVTVSSLTHILTTIRFDDLHSTRRYNKWQAYGQSKLANLLFCFELQRRLERGGHPAISVAAHPGYAHTNLVSVGPQLSESRLAEGVFGLGNRLIAQDASAGALPTLYAATATGVRGGEYFGPAGLAQLRGPPVRVRALPRAHDPETAARLWRVSTDQTGVAFPGLT